MAVSLFTYVQQYAHALETASHILVKGAEHAAANGVGEAEMLDWRLVEDMSPLRFQVMVVCNFARQWPARAAGLPVPADITDDLDLAGFQAAIAQAKAYLADLKPEQFAGRDDVPLTIAIGPGMEPTLPAGRWLAIFATTNLYFHLSTAYGILRSRGVPIGKVDLFPGGL
ncbi:DUF1993 domain-containing protein [Phenylobacterium sp.]|uniref:DUF1993 domain-containing protein n=1 Tax=Phenylobacterium sp. TaxID=1871053 RepID=UPI0027379C49|nr:DUF1993 domain-containing protein [Phenylobacterium sp.]MDP3869085.1 DUF1993 domain-containing protein [Phenylobacterium sp.]